MTHEKDSNPKRRVAWSEGQIKAFRAPVFDRRAWRSVSTHKESGSFAYKSRTSCCRRNEDNNARDIVVKVTVGYSLEFQSTEMVSRRPTPRL